MRLGSTGVLATLPDTLAGLRGGTRKEKRGWKMEVSDGRNVMG